MFNYKFSKRSNDIKKLKEGLMAKSPKTDNTLSSVRQVINETTGKIFEKNIRHILENNYGFKLLKYPEKIFIKKIRVNRGDKIQDEEIFQNEEATIKINNKKYIFLFNERFEVFIKDEDNKIIHTILSKDSNKESKINLDDDIVIISPYKEMEIDDYFKIEKFEVNMFNSNEIDILYSNVNKNDEKFFTNTIIEVKLGSNKVDNLISQIRKDYHLLNLKNKNDTLVIGFINSNKITNKNHFDTLSNKKCVIYGIKNSIFCGKEVTYQIDWDLEKRVKSLEGKIDEIYKYIKKQENDVEKIKEMTNTLVMEQQVGIKRKKEEEKRIKEKSQKKEKKKEEYFGDKKLLNIKSKREYSESEEEDLDD